MNWLAWTWVEKIRKFGSDSASVWKQVSARKRELQTSVMYRDIGGCLPNPSFTPFLVSFCSEGDGGAPRHLQHVSIKACLSSHSICCSILLRCRCCECCSSGAAATLK